MVRTKRDQRTESRPEHKTPSLRVARLSQDSDSSPSMTNEIDFFLNRKDTTLSEPNFRTQSLKKDFMS